MKLAHEMHTKKQNRYSHKGNDDLAHGSLPAAPRFRGALGRWRRKKARAVRGGKNCAVREGRRRAIAYEAKTLSR